VFFDPFAILPKLFINGKKPLPLINADFPYQTFHPYMRNPPWNRRISFIINPTFALHLAGKRYLFGMNRTQRRLNKGTCAPKCLWI
jgi:hypothetical protein